MSITKELLRKWFGLEAEVCPVCEVLREQLVNSERERRELLQRALVPSPEPLVPTEKEVFQPIRPQFVPWRVRQQILEAEDRKKAQILKDKETELKDIEKLEKELEVNA